MAVQKEKIGRRAIIYTIISRCSDAHSHLIFERNDGIRTGYAPEAESRTWSSRLLFFYLAAKVKNYRIKFQIFHFTFTSLLACPTSLLDVYPTVIQTIEKIKKLTKKTIGLKTSDVNIKIFRLTLWIPQYLYSQITT